ncbi:MAG: tyrosine-type recombinase/integrase, partial [Thermoguttaceae bacterium]|nr:tyrosine-type recombinase/integrase [Thermoguttaceae bacterium]
MASVFKQIRKKRIPTGAEIVEKRGKRIATWTSRGRTRRAELSVDGKSILVPDPNYTVTWFDWEGKRHKASGGPDRDAAQALGRQKETEAMQRRQGLIDPRAEKTVSERRRPIADHLADFRRSLEAKGDTPEHVALILARLTRVLEMCKVERIGDMSPSEIAAAVADLHTEGLSLRTCNGYLRAIKQFSRWLYRDGRATSDTLAHLTAYNVETDRRRERRVLSPEEFRLLVEAAEAGSAVEGIPGDTRAMMYILAAWTGFRRRELSSITLRSFDFQAEPATVTIEAAYAKNRRQDTQPLHPTVAQRLRTWLEVKTEINDDAPLFPLRTPGRSWRKTGKMMRLDLERAGLPYADEDGLYADFHAHRHAFISNLGKAGVLLATAQKLARHSDPTLTANIYTHLGVSDKAAAIDMLPECPAYSKNTELGEQWLNATGTDDPQAERSCGDQKGEHLVEQSAGKTWRVVTNSTQARMEKRTIRKSLRCQEMAIASSFWRLLAKVPPAGFEPATTGLG